MSLDDPMAAAKVGAVAGVAGGIARVVLALHGGERRPLVLAIEVGVGGVVGIVVSGIALWMLPELRSVGWPILTIAAFSGLGGALGTRALNLLARYVERRAGAAP